MDFHTYLIFKKCIAFDGDHSAYLFMCIYMQLNLCCQILDNLTYHKRAVTFLTVAPESPTARSI